MDSMVANYTAKKKKRHNDDLTPGGINNKRPDRAIIRYTNLIKQFSPTKIPIILGGIEATLRRVAHYDYWSDTIRKSILLDSKADILVYGEGERTILELANMLKIKKSPQIEPDLLLHQRGICFLGSTSNNKFLPVDYLKLPDYDSVVAEPNKFKDMFDIFYQNNDPLNAKG